MFSFENYYLFIIKYIFDLIIKDFFSINKIKYSIFNYVNIK